MGTTNATIKLRHTSLNTSRKQTRFWVGGVAPFQQEPQETGAGAGGSTVELGLGVYLSPSYVPILRGFPPTGPGRSWGASHLSPSPAQSTM